MNDKASLIGGATDRARRQCDALGCKQRAIISMRYRGARGFFSYCGEHAKLADDEKVFPPADWTKEVLLP